MNWRISERTFSCDIVCVCNKMMERNESDLRLQTAYCKYLAQSFTWALDALAELIPRRRLTPNKIIVMDFDAVFTSEDATTNYEMFTCAVNFVKTVKDKYRDEIRIVIITARPEVKDLYADLDSVGIDIGKRPNTHVYDVLYDSTSIGTQGSKLRHRVMLRMKGATIIAAIGDQLTDLVCDAETNMHADTLNILLPNIYRHLTLHREDDEE